MAFSTLMNASDILNRVAAEVGIQPVADPYASQDPFFIQLQYLLNIAGEELMQAYPWEVLVKSHSITTQVGDSGEYSMPADFGYLLNQTSWDNTNRVPMGGPLSAQDWTYLKGRDLASNTLYASFRISQGKFNVFPDAPTIARDLSFEYISCNWVSNSIPAPANDRSDITLPSNAPLYDKTLISRALKVKYLEAGGFDTGKAQADYNQIFAFLTGNDKGAPILNAGRSNYGIPYLSSYNVGDTGFGGGQPV